MIIHIHKRENPYAQIDRRALEDDRLSFKAKGVLAYLISRPPDWNVRMHDLASRSTDGMASVQSAMKELQTFGYASYKVTIDPDTKQITGSNWTVRETPEVDETTENIEDEPQVDFPHTEKPHAGNPHCGKAARGKVPCLVRRTVQKNKCTNEGVTKEEVAFPESLNSEVFKTAWSEWLLHLKEKKTKPTPSALKKQMAKCEAWGVIIAVKNISHAIEKNWQSLFEPHVNAYGRKPQVEVDHSKGFAPPNLKQFEQPCTLHIPLPGETDDVGELI